jgi:hypothetical protein
MVAMADPAERERTLERHREIWNEVAGIVEDAYAEVAPARLVEAARTGGQGATQ